MALRLLGTFSKTWKTWKGCVCLLSFTYTFSPLHFTPGQLSPSPCFHTPPSRTFPWTRLFFLSLRSGPASVPAPPQPSVRPEGFRPQLQRHLVLPPLSQQLLLPPPPSPPPDRLPRHQALCDVNADSLGAAEGAGSPQVEGGGRLQRRSKIQQGPGKDAELTPRTRLPSAREVRAAPWKPAQRQAFLSCGPRAARSSRSRNQSFVPAGPVCLIFA